MAKLDKAISNGENTMLFATGDFSDGVKDIEEKLLKEIIKILNVLDIKDGKIQSSEAAIQFLASIDKRITEALKNSGYNSKVREFLKSFDVILKNNIDVHKLANDINITADQLNLVTKLEVENTLSKLTGSGISRDFIQPIRESLYRNITLGSSIQDTKQTIEDYIISNDGKDSKLLRYTTQVARDSISQYDGSIQKAIANELGLNDFIYSGSIIADSRCQCRYWVHKIKLQHDELVDEIATALDGGSLDGCQCSGMIPGTTIENFSINRGGYSCRHRAIATNLDK